MDYSEHSIALAKRIQESYVEKYKEEDADKSKHFSTIEFKFEDAFQLQDKDKFDIIHDKGTFDVVFMNHDLNNVDYAKAMRHRLNDGNPEAFFILTSCNCTSTELDDIFVGPGLFEKKTEIKGYRQFTFGGVTGQNVSTNVY